MLSAVLFGLLSAIAWGAGDFCGGLAARRANVYTVVVGAQLVGAALLIGLALLFRERVPPVGALLWGTLAGLGGVVGLTALYQALAQGRMGIAAPFSAVLAAALPVLVAAVSEGLPDIITLLGFGLALLSVWLLSQPDTARFSYRDLGLPLVAGLGFGLFFIAIDRAGDEAVFWPLVAARLVAFSLLAAITMLNRKPPVPGLRTLPLVILAGMLDAGGNAFFTLAAQAGRLDVAAVLSSLYSATTVLLAWLILRERMTRVQLVGTLTALTAIVFISL